MEIAVFVFTFLSLTFNVSSTRVSFSEASADLEGVSPNDAARDLMEAAQPKIADLIAECEKLKLENEQLNEEKEKFDKQKDFMVNYCCKMYSDRKIYDAVVVRILLTKFLKNVFQSLRLVFDIFEMLILYRNGCQK